MEKKNGLLTAALLATVFLMGSCSSEDSEMGTPAQSGSPILFSVADVQPRTRTEYEDRLQINWVKNDEIGICSPSDNVLPSVEGGPKNATYKVTALNADGHPHHAEIIKPSEEKNYLKWGDNLNTRAVFYGAYPAERIVKYPDENSSVFSMEYYTNQECEVVYPSENGVYLTKPDMKNAYMVAKNELTPIGDHVLLAFDPIMTTPDITITAGSYEVGTGIIQPVTVTGVSVIMPNKLSSSDLNYQITDLTNVSITAPHGKLLNIVDGQESVFIQIDNKGKKYIDLYEGESINLMAFLPPIPQLKGAKIQVHTLGTTFVIKVEEELKAQSRITIKLPDITPETTKPNNWISKLDGSTLLKEMSIPAYVCKGTETPDDIKKLLKKGVRAFDAQALTSSSWGKHTINKDFVDVCNEYLKGYTTEFIIVWTENNIKDTSWEMFTNEINQARGKVILIQKHNKGLLNSDHFTNNGKSDKLFGFNTVVEKFDLTNSDWNAMLNNEVANNKILYDKIVTSTKQSGCTGIVTIPGAEKSFDSSYGDLLLQAVIDCNFKLRRNSIQQQ